QYISPGLRPASLGRDSDPPSLDPPEFDQMGGRLAGAPTVPRSGKACIYHMAGLSRAEDRGVLRRTHGEKARQTLRRTLHEARETCLDGRPNPPARPVIHPGKAQDLL